MAHATRYVDSDEVIAIPAPATDRDFDSFATEVRADLAPTTLLERVLAERVILAAWRLQLVSTREAAAARAPRPGKPSLPLIARETLRAESSLETALTILHAARLDRPRWGHASPVDSKALDASEDYEVPADYLDYSNEWPTLGDQDVDTSESPDGEVEVEGAAMHLVWRDRLVFDDKVSAESPVVKGTWVTAGHVVSLIVDGWAWSDVLRTHPELNEDDIRACLAYTVDMDVRGGA